MYLEVCDATFDRTGEDSNRNPIGTVVVTLANDEFREFEDVDERDFATWRDAGLDLEEPPYDMAASFEQWLKTFDDEDDDEDEEELDDAPETDDEEEDETDDEW
jgi:hypothetical protein